MAGWRNNGENRRNESGEASAWHGVSAAWHQRNIRRMAKAKAKKEKSAACRREIA
jgi:hypothetical protein